MTTKRKLIITAFLLSLSIIFTYIGRNNLNFSVWYSTHIYPFLVNTIGRFFSVFPFSAVEFLLYTLVLIILFSFIKGIISFIKKTSNFKKHILRWLGNTVLFLSFLLLLYTFQCGINYYTLSFSEYSQLSKESYTLEELADLCEYLTDCVNELAPKVARDENGIAVPAANIKKEAISAMKNLGTIYPCLSGYYPQPKALTFSEILSYQHLSGIYSPFTIEASYNNDMTPYNIPFTVCHELAHLKSFMREDEANFISYLACIHSSNIDFSYSGYLLAWIYASNELSKAAPDYYETLRFDLDPLVYADLKDNNLFWTAYDGKTAEISTHINDTYLKANKQSSGVDTYNEMVTLLIAYYSSESFSSIPSQR